MFIPIIGLFIIAVGAVFIHKAGVSRYENSESMLGGVCQGIAYRTGLPVALVRILTVLFALGTAGEVELLYLVLWATLPRG